jgi:hypothetical protein
MLKSNKIKRKQKEQIMTPEELLERLKESPKIKWMME